MEDDRDESDTSRRHVPAQDRLPTSCLFFLHILDLSWLYAYPSGFIVGTIVNVKLLSRTAAGPVGSCSAERRSEWMK
jgi:hypothetical protein